MFRFSNILDRFFHCSSACAAALVGAGLAVGVCAPAQAHHSTAMFDMSKEVVVTGAVKEFNYVNPHSWLIFMADTVDGKPVAGGTIWSFELGNPSNLIRAGIKKSSFKPGDKFTIHTHPMKDGRPAGTVQTAIRPDGTIAVHPYRPPGPGAAPTQ